MTQPVPSSSCGRLAAHLAELSHQLRHCSSPDSSPDGQPEALPRLTVSGRLVAGLGHDSGQVDLVRFGAVLQELLDKWTSVPESFPPELDRPLENLADWLDRLLARADNGESPGTLVNEGGWDAVLVLFQHAGTPLEILDEMANLLLNWEHDWGRTRLDPQLAEPLLQGWQSLDGLAQRILKAGFEEGAETTNSPVSENSDFAWHLALLIDSPLRRNHLQESLQATYPRVSIMGDPQEVLPWVNRVVGKTAILCDNIEPSNNLRLLRKLLVGGVFRSELPRLILVAPGGGPHPDHLERRATALGAWGVWLEPFELGNLAELLR